MSLPIDPRNTLFGDHQHNTVIIAQVVPTLTLDNTCNWHDKDDPSKIDGGPLKILKAYPLPYTDAKERFGQSTTVVGDVYHRNQIVTVVEFEAKTKYFSS